ncbi:hypothetical protein AB6A40_001141 [Gnathostoma spinigerum]|uniref:Uncharacterized protein n=1 Tax=Gnathostoma spinigerum TaxID=75299 RepID=A0ABD6ECL4_9BILA
MDENLSTESRQTTYSPRLFDGKRFSKSELNGTVNSLQKQSGHYAMTKHEKLRFRLMPPARVLHRNRFLQESRPSSFSDEKRSLRFSQEVPKINELSTVSTQQKLKAFGTEEAIRTQREKTRKKSLNEENDGISRENLKFRQLRTDNPDRGLRSSEPIKERIHGLPTVENGIRRQSSQGESIGYLDFEQRQSGIHQKAESRFQGRSADDTQKSRMQERITKPNEFLEKTDHLRVILQIQHEIENLRNEMSEIKAMLESVNATIAVTFKKIGEHLSERKNEETFMIRPKFLKVPMLELHSNANLSSNNRQMTSKMNIDTFSSSNERRSDVNNNDKLSAQRSVNNLFGEHVDLATRARVRIPPLYWKYSRPDSNSSFIMMNPEIIDASTRRAEFLLPITDKRFQVNTVVKQSLHSAKFRKAEIADAIPNENKTRLRRPFEESQKFNETTLRRLSLSNLSETEDSNKKISHKNNNNLGSNGANLLFLSGLPASQIATLQLNSTANFRRITTANKETESSAKEHPSSTNTSENREKNESIVHSSLWPEILFS